MNKYVFDSLSLKYTPPFFSHEVTFGSQFTIYINIRWYLHCIKYLDLNDWMFQCYRHAALITVLQIVSYFMFLYPFLLLVSWLILLVSSFCHCFSVLIVGRSFGSWSHGSWCSSCGRTCRGYYLTSSIPGVGGLFSNIVELLEAFVWMFSIMIQSCYDCMNHYFIFTG